MTGFQWQIWVAFLGALVLSIIPLPDLIAEFRPPWMLLLVLYLEYFLPSKFKLTSLLLVGLLLDVLLSTVIGEHSFVLLLVTWIASNKSRRFQFFAMPQQICFIGFLCLLYQALISFIDSLLGFNYSLFLPVASAFTSMLFWPWIRLLGDGSLLVKSRW